MYFVLSWLLVASKVVGILVVEHFNINLAYNGVNSLCDSCTFIPEINSVRTLVQDSGRSDSTCTRRVLNSELGLWPGIEVNSVSTI